MFGPQTQVLVVDDLHGTRKHLVKVLVEMGFKSVTEAADGEKAWEILASSTAKIGLIISDWNMPNLSGLELLKRVRETESTANIPFLLATSQAEKTLITEAVKAGVDGYILKPFTASTLSQKLRIIDGKRR